MKFKDNFHNYLSLTARLGRIFSFLLYFWERLVVKYVCEISMYMQMIYLITSIVNQLSHPLVFIIRVFISSHNLLTIFSQCEKNSAHIMTHNIRWHRNYSHNTFTFCLPFSKKEAIFHSGNLGTWNGKKFLQGFDSIFHTSKVWR